MKKKFACVLAAIASLTILAGCEKVDKEKYVGNSSSSSEINSSDFGSMVWTDMTFMLDQKTYTLPFEYKDIKETGWSFNPAAYGLENISIDPGLLLSRSVYLQNDNFDEGVLAVGFTNNKSEKVGIDDAVVWAVEVSSKDAAKAPEVVLPGNVKFGMTIDEIKAIYGEPSEEQRHDDEGYTEYRYVENGMKGLHLDFYDDGGFCKFIYENYNI